MSNENTPDCNVETVDVETVLAVEAIDQVAGGNSCPAPGTSLIDWQGVQNTYYGGWDFMFDTFGPVGEYWSGVVFDAMNSTN